MFDLVRRGTLETRSIAYALFLGVFLAYSYPLALHAALVNINTADAAELETLPGIGPAKATDIIAYRDAHGPFHTKEDIKNVSGIGDATYANIEPYITVSGGTAAEEEEVPDDPPESISDTADENDDGDNVSVSLTPPDRELSFEVDAPSRAHVNQPIVFRATPTGIGDVLADSVAIAWNFGDTHTGAGTEVTHAYAYPGEYAVVVHGGYARHSAEVRHMITVLPVDLSIAHSDAGELMVHNDAPYEVDLTGFALRGAGTFSFPPKTVIMPRATLTIPRARYAASPHTATLLVDSAGSVVAASGVEEPPSPIAAIPMHAAPVDDTASVFSFASDMRIAPQAEAAELPSQNPSVQNAAPAEKGMPTHALPYLGLIGVLAASMFALYAGKRGA